MGVLRYGVKVKKKEFSFAIPDFLAESIDLLIHGCNSNDLLADCYMDDLYDNINCCRGGELSDEQLEEIRDYYIRGGMYLEG